MTPSDWPTVSRVLSEALAVTLAVVQARGPEALPRLQERAQEVLKQVKLL